MKLYRGYKDFCWMNLEALYYAFLGPVCVVLAVNLVIYLLVMVQVCRLARGRKRMCGPGTPVVTVRASVTCFVVLGLSWFFALLARGAVREVFHFLFTVTTTLQGLLIFLLFTAKDPTVRAFWAQTFSRLRARGSAALCGRGQDTSTSMKTESTA